MPGTEQALDQRNSLSDGRRNSGMLSLLLACYFSKRIRQMVKHDHLMSAFWNVHPVSYTFTPSSFGPEEHQIFNFFHFYYFMCMSVFAACMSITSISGAGNGGKPLCRCWDSNSGPLQQQVLLTTELILQSLHF